MPKPAINVTPLIDVFVKAPKSMAYGKVIEVVDSVTTVGTIPLVLQIDDLPG